MKTFVANLAQTREFIDNFKSANLSLSHYNVEIVDGKATFSTNTGKVFVVNTSDLTSSKEIKGDSLWAIMCMVDLGAIKHETLKSSEAPEEKIYSTHIDDNSPTIDVDESFDEMAEELAREFDEDFLNHQHNFGEYPESVFDEEDSHLSIDEVDDFITEINDEQDAISAFSTDSPEFSSLIYTQNQQETALKAAKIVFHYWALSGNSWNVPYDYDTLADLTNNLSKKLNRNIYITFVDEALNIGNAILNLRFLGDFLVLGDDFNLFLQMLENQAVNYGVYSWFTPSELSVYQQNYQHIVADCTAILELYRQSDILADNGEGEYQLFPQNTKELHALISYIQDKSTADSIVESLKGEEYLFFQVLDTLNSINQTKPAMICA
jgi:hypothetical protein